MSTEKQLSNYQMVRCHKTAIINPEYIVQLTGNSKNRMIYLNHLNSHGIPVSRNFVASPH
ncbi:MAG: LytTR family transcriptional regulator [Bacteroidales bacterium]|nr:LytTR family transcriptional regulator [Bacteroidales bacterium]